MSAINPNNCKSVTALSRAGVNTSATGADLTQLLKQSTNIKRKLDRWRQLLNKYICNKTQTFISNKGYNYLPQDCIYIVANFAIHMGNFATISLNIPDVVGNIPDVVGNIHPIVGNISDVIRKFLTLIPVF